MNQAEKEKALKKHKFPSCSGGPSSKLPPIQEEEDHLDERFLESLLPHRFEKLPGGAKERRADKGGKREMDSSDLFLETSLLVGFQKNPESHKKRVPNRPLKLLWFPTWWLDGNQGIGGYANLVKRESLGATDQSSDPFAEGSAMGWQTLVEAGVVA